MPAGTLREALEAFRNGADAVYFGLKEFSARKGAGNFSEEDLSKIRRYALSEGKKIYITLNTILSDRDLPRAYGLLAMLDGYGCDGVIVQDLGVSRLIRKHFPALPLHASTQLAVHTASGLRALKRLGFTRAVLSRELSLDEIKKLRGECPDIELKVFIHGALCYGFSGLCMASSLITGRSANKGECAQICRTWFTDEDSGKKVYPFSLQDLDAGLLVRKLMETGIDSLKVEGRLKGPEYVGAVTRYYRAIIDGKDPEPFRHQAACSFCRKSGTGYLVKRPEPLTTGHYTGHRGEWIGRVEGQRGRKLYVSSKADIKARDGLLLLTDSFSYKFPARPLSDGTLLLPEQVDVPEGADVYRISDSSLNVKEISLNLPLMKKQVDAEVILQEGSLTVRTEYLERTYPVQTAPGEHSPEEAILKIFSQSGDSPLQLRPSVKAIQLYASRSALKDIRKEYLSELEGMMTDPGEYKPESFEKQNTIILPPRKLLDGKRTPWNTEGVSLGDHTYFSFPAMRFDEPGVFREMEEKAKAAGNAMIGLNNIGDLEFAQAHPEFSYFADIYFYVANREAAALLSEAVPSLKGAYLQIEQKSYDNPWPFEPSVITGYQPPLFISRACYRHDGLFLPCKGCGKHHTFHCRQNGKRYEVLVDNCQTIVKQV